MYPDYFNTVWVMLSVSFVPNSEVLTLSDIVLLKKKIKLISELKQ